MRTTPFLTALLLAGSLSACAVGPNYHANSATDLGVPTAYSVRSDQRAQDDLTHWWTNFDDPMLALLVEQGRATNLDVAQAVTRLRQARESLVQARAALLPSLTGSAGYSRTVTVNGLTIPGVAQDSLTLGLDPSYQVDLFGGNRRNAEAARADYQSSGFSYAQTLISVESEIAQDYILARLAQSQLANSRASLAIEDDNLQITDWRVQAGLASSLDYEQARAQRAQTAATVPQIEASYNSSVSELALLTGQAPGALKSLLDAVKPIPKGPADIAVGIPIDTLRQRPDVRAAERSLASATARIGVAQAQLYPALTIGGDFSAGAAHIGNIFDAISGQLFATIAQTIFDGGRLRSQVRSNRDAAEGAFYAYKSSVLSALKDVENAVVALHSAEVREGFYATALDASNNSEILARSQYRTGLTDFTTLDQAETTLLSARDGLAQAQSDKATALVQLFLALGGGWDSSHVPSADTVPAPVPVPTPASQDR